MDKSGIYGQPTQNPTNSKKILETLSDLGLLDGVLSRQQINALTPPTTNRQTQPSSLPEEFISADKVRYSHETVPQSINQMQDQTHVSAEPQAQPTIYPERVHVSAGPLTGSVADNGYIVSPHAIGNDGTLEPPFALTPLEADLGPVLQHAKAQGQTLYTMENVFIQQCLRSLMRLTSEVAELKELVKRNHIPEIDPPRLLTKPLNQSIKFVTSTENNGNTQEEDYQEEETSNEEFDFIDDEPTDVQRSGGSPKKAEGKSRKRRRRKRNRKNQR